MAVEEIKIPDIGGAEGVDVIEVCVEPGEVIELEQTLIVLESDKSSMEIPSSAAGKVVELKINEGDTASEGDVILTLEVSSAAAETAPEPEASEVAAEPEVASQAAPAESSPVQPQEQQSSQELAVSVPDLGGADNVDVIEVCVSAGDKISEGDSLIVLETDKASMEVPAPASGTIVSITVAEGDKLSEGDAICVMQTQGSAAGSTPSDTASAPSESTVLAKPADKNDGPPMPVPQAASEQDFSPSGSEVYAGPAVRRLARQLGIDLKDVKGSGPRNRLNKQDLRDYVKKIVTEKKSGGGSLGVPAIPEVDFSQFGEITLEKMSKIKKVTAANMSRNWLSVPHVTQFDEADITDLEDFRKQMKAEAEKRGVKLTPLPFLLKAAAAALRAEPSFNVSLHHDGEHIVKKDYVHIGIAADTPAGLMVPVIRDVDKKGIWELAEETVVMVQKARDGKLLPRDMQGGCFTISSLGAMGGTGFTPIVNTPEVAIMGVSKLQVKPVWNGSEFVPRKMLPVTVSYDHRAINGADCGRFFTYMVAALGDVRRLLL